MSDLVPVKRALISVFDKTGLKGTNSPQPCRES